MSYSLAGKYEQAIEAFNRALETDRSQRTYNNLGLVLFKLGRYQEAFEAFKKAGTEAEVTIIWVVSICSTVTMQKRFAHLRKL